MNNGKGLAIGIIVGSLITSAVNDAAKPPPSKVGECRAPAIAEKIIDSQTKTIADLTTTLKKSLESAINQCGK